VTRIDVIAANITRPTDLVCASPDGGVGPVRGDHQRVLDAYRQAWNSGEETAVRQQLERCWTPHSVYANPFVDPVTGIDGLTDLILDYHALFPDLSLQATAVAIHDDHLSYRWLLTSSASIRIKGTAFGHRMTGQDMIAVDEGGRLARVVAFLDGLTVPAPDRVAPARLR
jgi:hypothetical protein